MTEPQFDTTQVAIAARASWEISEGVQNSIREMQMAADIPSNWKGAANLALREQILMQRQELTKLSEALDRGSDALERLGYGVSDVDTTAASGMANAGEAPPPSGGTLTPSSTPSSSLVGEPLNRA